jgi:hypothetical protein
VLIICRYFIPKTNFNSSSQWFNVLTYNGHILERSGGSYRLNQSQK